MTEPFRKLSQEEMQYDLLKLPGALLSAYSKIDELESYLDCPGNAGGPHATGFYACIWCGENRVVRDDEIELLSKRLDQKEKEIEVLKEEVVRVGSTQFVREVPKMLGNLVIEDQVSRSKLFVECEGAKARIRKLEAALKVYADEKNWTRWSDEMEETVEHPDDDGQVLFTTKHTVRRTIPRTVHAGIAKSALEEK